MSGKVLRTLVLGGLLSAGVCVAAMPARAAQTYDCCECKPDPANPNQTVCACGRSLGAPYQCSTCLRLCGYA